MEEIKDGSSGTSAAAAPPAFRRRHTCRALELPSPAGFFLEVPSDDKPRHFLDHCSLCSKSLSGNADIFMYRGNIPFCSNECRDEQIYMDEEKEKNWKIGVKKEQQQKSSSTSSESRKIHVRAGIDVAG